MNEKTKIETPPTTENMQLSLLPASPERTDTMTHDPNSSVASSVSASVQQVEATTAVNQIAPSPESSSQLTPATATATATTTPAKTTSTTHTTATLVPSKTLENARAASQSAATIIDTAPSSATTIPTSSEATPETAVEPAAAPSKTVEAPGTVAERMTPPAPATTPAAGAVSESVALSEPTIPQTHATVSAQDNPSEPATVLAATSTPSPATTPQSSKQSTNPSAEDKGKDFEAALSELEKIVGMLEGEVKLEDALRLFDRGMNLSQHCQECLEEAEQRIDILKRAINGNLTSEKFNEESISAI